MSNEKFEEGRGKLANLWFIAKNSCVPALFGGSVCILAMIVMNTAGFDSYFVTDLPESFNNRFSVDQAKNLVEFSNQVDYRLIWGLSAVGLMIATGGVVLVAFQVISTQFNQNWCDLHNLVLWVTFGFAGSLFVFAFAQQIYEVSSAGPNNLLVLLLGRMNVQNIFPLWILPAILNSCVVSVTFLLSFSFSAIIVPVELNQRDRVEDLIDRIANLHGLLYIGVVCLVARVIEYHAIYLLPAAYLSEDEAVFLHKIAASTTTAVGVIFSLFLASIYFPAAKHLQHRLTKCVRFQLAINKQAKRPTDQTIEEAETKTPATGPFADIQNVNQAIREFGADASPHHEFFRIFTLFVPAIVGMLQDPVATVVGNVLSAIAGK